MAKAQCLTLAAVNSIFVKLKLGCNILSLTLEQAPAHNARYFGVIWTKRFAVEIYCFCLFVIKSFVFL